ncbi:hypothetical protein KAI04_04810 [Candidatus Pacearchaeota archaeon]|nr:hypothetical protein [Candidatus Pacearchaeota archaeon]
MPAKGQKSHRKGITWKEEYGDKKAKEMKIKRTEVRRKNNPDWFSDKSFFKSKKHFEKLSKGSKESWQKLNLNEKKVRIKKSVDALKKFYKNERKQDKKEYENKIDEIKKLIIDSNNKMSIIRKLKLCRKKFDKYIIINLNNNYKKMLKENSKKICKHKQTQERREISIKNNLRNRLRQIFKRDRLLHELKISKEYGISYENIINKLKPFPKDYNNYQIDHIIPLKLFSAKKPERLKYGFGPDNIIWITKDLHNLKQQKLVHPDFYKQKI